MSLNKRLRIFGVLAIVIVVGVFIFKLVTTSTIVISVNPTTSPIDTVVTIDGKKAVPSGNGGQKYAAKVGFGKHMITVMSPGYVSGEASVSTSFRSTKEAVINLESISAEDIARSIAGETNGLEIRTPVLFGENNWIVFYIGSTSGQSDSLLVVARFNTTSSAWEVVLEGTDSDTSVLAENNAPSELIYYLRSGNL